MIEPIDERILDCIKSGKNYSLIGERLGLTRDAVSGRVRRMKERGVVIPCPVQRARTPKPPTPTDRVTIKVTKPSTNPIETPDEGTGVRLVDLPANACLFPTGYRGEHLFCGQPRMSLTSSYCEHHHKISWVKIRNK